MVSRVQGILCYNFMSKVAPETNKPKSRRRGSGIYVKAMVDAVSHEADEVTDELADDLIRRQRSKYVEIHNLHEHVGCDLRKTPTILHMREAAGEGLLMWQV